MFGKGRGPIPSTEVVAIGADNVTYDASAKQFKIFDSHQSGVTQSAFSLSLQIGLWDTGLLRSSPNIVVSCFNTEGLRHEMCARRFLPL